MKINLLLAAAVAAISLGSAGAQAATGDAPAVEQAKHFKFHFYYGYKPYYYYYPYYYYQPYYYCPYWKKIKGWC